MKSRASSVWHTASRRTYRRCMKTSTPSGRDTTATKAGNFPWQRRTLCGPMQLLLTRASMRTGDRDRNRTKPCESALVLGFGFLINRIDLRDVAASVLSQEEYPLVKVHSPYPGNGHVRGKQ